MRNADDTFGILCDTDAGGAETLWILFGHPLSQVLSTEDETVVSSSHELVVLMFDCMIQIEGSTFTSVGLC